MTTPPSHPPSNRPAERESQPTPGSVPRVQAAREAGDGSDAEGVGKSAEGVRGGRPPREDRWTLSHAIGRMTSVSVLRAFFGFRAYHPERIPATGPALIVANHQSFLDPIAIGGPVTQRQLSYLARAGLFTHPLAGRLLRSFHAVPIRENTGDASAIREILRRLQEGDAVVVFPEGSRSPDGEVHEFKRGIALLIKRARCPVVPVAIEGAFEAWPRHRKWPRLLGGRIRSLYAEPIPYDELMKDGPDAALDRLRRIIVEMCQTLRAMDAR
ncbi:MAG: lysophospholipid acyltransferase family protein [Planctomycetota bacterium]|nr:lysophospholipid acyltransferase family protein [Planctomycetota bacterium]